MGYFSNKIVGLKMEKFEPKFLDYETEEPFDNFMEWITYSSYNDIGKTVA